MIFMNTLPLYGVLFGYLLLNEPIQAWGSVVSLAPLARCTVEVSGLPVRVPGEIEAVTVHWAPWKEY
jgi:enamine deaminase RidA (YjgF/YER057c/UK114 family)